MKRKLIFIIWVLLIGSGLYAQIQVRGVVRDQEGLPLPGANIVIKGSAQGTITDLEGNFTLDDVTTETVFVVSFIGMLPEELTVGNQTQFEISLSPDIMELEDVVVIGYGTIKRKNLTGAISSVKSEEITMSPVSNTIEAIQGRVAGLDITRSDGRAGSGMSILLRGERSIAGGDEPIYIIDGIQGSINNLNPGDIESIDVLKDASSTAIYGSSGANGVIMITTKRARKGSMQIDLNSYVSINSHPSFPKPLQKEAWLNYLGEGYIASYVDAPADRDALLSAWGVNPDILNPYIDNGKWVDWIDESLQTGIQHNTDLSIRTGNEKVQSSFSTGYNRTEGIYKNDYLDRFSLRENLNIDASDQIKLGIITGLIYSNRESRPSRINKSFGMIPVGDVYDEDGEINPFPVEGMTDVISVLADNIDGTYSDNRKAIHITANPYIEITPVKGLSLKSILGTSLSSGRQGVFNSDHTYMILAGSQPPVKYSTYSNDFGYSYIWENILDYKITLAGDHNVGATFITSYSNSQSESSGSYSEDFTYDEYLFYNLDAGINPSVNTWYEVYKRMSYAGRLNYNFRGKYFFTGSIRYDGVSQLAKTWDAFPSGAVAWRISEEPFMDWAKNWLSYFKIRAGYGVAGSDNIGAYSTKSEVTNGHDNMNLGGGQVQTTVPTQSITNLSLGWEKTYSLNIGLDFGMFDGRISGSAEWYDQDSRHLIYNRDLPFSSGGFGPKWAYTLADNIARMNNTGFEITLNTLNIQKSDFQWNSTLTFSMNWNEITSIELGSGKTAEDLISEGLFIGSPREVHYSYKKIGIWQLGEEADAAVFGLQPGDVKIESSLIKESDGVWYKIITDEEGNDSTAYYTEASPYTINANEDRQILGQEKPKWIAGFQNKVTYKGFDLNIFMTARWGHMIQGELLGYFDYGKMNIPDNYDYWTETNPTNDYPRPYQSRSTSAYSQPLGQDALAYVDASYLKIKNITLGYTVPKRLIDRTFFSNLRIYGTVYNFLIITKSHLLDGVDPESGASDSFPLYKQMVFGLNVSF
jgi:TonB-linked SusC/RagA family outer membrane protein